MGAEAFVPHSRSLAVLARAAEGCRGCDLYKRATQTVFGAGRRGARLMLVGEQPGDKEDITGLPFVGPAGALLDKALAAARIDRRDAYVTNAVKHFKWRERGKRRMHDKPSGEELRACRPWLLAELRAVGPSVIVCMGTTAARSVLSRSVAIARARGMTLEREGVPCVVTYHPSAILRMEGEDRHITYDMLVADLRRAGGLADASGLQYQR